MPRAYVIPRPENLRGMSYGNFRNWLKAHLSYSKPVSRALIPENLEWRYLLDLCELCFVDAHTLRMPDGLVEEIWENLQRRERLEKFGVFYPF